MSYTAAALERTVWSKVKGVLSVLCAGLLSSACAGGTGLGEQSLAMLSESKPKAHQAAPSGPEALTKATEYWRKEYQKKPKDKDAALNYARNLKALGAKKQALAVLQHASNFHPTKKDVAGEYGRLALDLGQVSVAQRLLSVADDPVKPDWRVISARGTVLAKKGEYNAAIPYYQRALSLAPAKSSILNNLALAQLMNGDAKSAESMLRKVIAKGGPHAAKARQNLALALGVQGKYHEATTIASSVLPKAQAQSNANYLKKLVKLEAVDVPAPVPTLARAPVPAVQTAAATRRPLTPDDIIAQAKAAAGNSNVAAVARRQAPVKRAKVVKAKAKSKASVVRTVAKSKPAAAALPFKPSSF